MKLLVCLLLIWTQIACSPRAEDPTSPPVSPVEIPKSNNNGDENIPVYSTGTRGGGDSNVIQFMMYANSLVLYFEKHNSLDDQQLRKMKETVSSLYSRMNSVDTASIVFVDERPKDQNEVEKEAVYDTSEVRIFVHRKSWDAKRDWEKLSLVALELTGLVGMNLRYERVAVFIEKNISEILNYFPLETRELKEKHDFILYSIEMTFMQTFNRELSRSSWLLHLFALRKFDEARQNKLLEIKELPRMLLTRVYSTNLIALNKNSPTSNRRVELTRYTTFSDSLIIVVDTLFNFKERRLVEPKYAEDPNESEKEAYLRLVTELVSTKPSDFSKMKCIWNLQEHLRQNMITKKVPIPYLSDYNATELDPYYVDQINLKFNPNNKQISKTEVDQTVTACKLEINRMKEIVNEYKKVNKLNQEQIFRVERALIILDSLQRYYNEESDLLLNLIDFVNVGDLKLQSPN
jgi:hypothetical protein